MHFISIMVFYRCSLFDMYRRTIINKHFLVVLFSLIFSYTSFGQTYNYATYDVNIDDKSFSKFLSDSEFDSFQEQMFRKLFEAANTTQLEVSFNDHLSECKPIKQLSVGNVSPRLAEGALSILIGLSKLIYLDNDSKFTYFERGRADITHLVKTEMEIPEWKISKEQKKVDKYNYRKATAIFTIENQEVNVEAWFCPELSVPFGPGNFHGLPGLITEVYVERDYSYSFILNKLEKKKNLKIEVPLDDYKVLSIEESDKLFDRVS